MKIERIQTLERTWYRATATIQNAKATGYGTTLYNAIADCIRDIEKIQSLKI